MDFRSDVIGKWVGSYELWFQPGEPHTGSMTTLQAVRKGDGPEIALRYEWSYEDADQTGMYFFSSSGDVAFTDTFHTSGSVMPCGNEGNLTVIGTYIADGAEWRWRTSFEMPSKEELTIRAWNISPDGETTDATAAVYKRI